MDGVAVLRALSFEYDSAGQLTAASDPSASYDYTYDALGRATTIVQDIAALPDEITFTQEFDAVGNRLALAAAIGATADFANDYTYDHLHRLIRIEQSAQSGGYAVAEKRIDFAYNAAGQFDSITRYANLAGTDLVVTSSYAYDGIGRIAELLHEQDTTTLAGYQYAWDAASRITAITNVLHAAESAAYGYDDRGQLTGADRTGSGNDETYAYDDNGNRETANGNTYTPGTNNQVESDGNFAYEYDAEGNRIRKTEISSGDYVTYEWDYRNRLVAVSFFDDSDVLQKRVEYEYDIFDRRVVKRVDADGDNDFDEAQFFAYDGAHIALVFDDAGSLTNRYLHGPVIDQILADEQVHWDAIGEDYVTDAMLWALADHLGTVRDVAEYNPGTDTTTVVNHLVIDSFGRITSETNTAVLFVFAFTGRERDDDALLLYFRRRYYDADMGQFVSEDPITFTANDPNLRRYVFNASTMLTDPFGLQTFAPPAPFAPAPVPVPFAPAPTPIAPAPAPIAPAPAPAPSPPAGTSPPKFTTPPSGLPFVQTAAGPSNALGARQSAFWIMMNKELSRAFKRCSFHDEMVAQMQQRVFARVASESDPLVWERIIRQEVNSMIASVDAAERMMLPRLGDCAVPPRNTETQAEYWARRRAEWEAAKEARPNGTSGTPGSNPPNGPTSPSTSPQTAPATSSSGAGSNSGSKPPAPPGSPGNPSGANGPYNWENYDSRNLRRWLESLETQAAQSPTNPNAGRLDPQQTRDLLDDLRRRGWQIPRGPETSWIGGNHINVIGPGGGPNIHLPIPPGFVP